MNKLVQLVTKLAAAFPRDNATEATLAVYIEQLQKCDIDVLEKIINNAIGSSTRLPTVAELRENYRHHFQYPVLGEALPLGRAPMPPEIKEQMKTMLGKMDERSAELDV